GTQLVKNFLAVRGIVDDNFILHIPTGPLLLAPSLLEPFFCHESYEGFRRIQRHQTQSLHFRKDDQRLIILERSSPILTPCELIHKILATQIIALDITIQQGLTLPTEHFHGHNRPTTGSRKAIQDGESRLDMK